MAYRISDIHPSSLFHEKREAYIGHEVDVDWVSSKTLTGKLSGYIYARLIMRTGPNAGKDIFIVGVKLQPPYTHSKET